MFRDSQEELNRLTEELLEGEDLPQVEEDILNDAVLLSLLAETNADEDAEEPAAVSAPKEKEPKDPVISVLTAVALLLLTGILGVLVWWIIQIRSLF